ncbi:hypothetical protein SeMB42_g02064 [Synchytrium endobioticum]|uniref:HMG box domain-containing protein n=1 Tax=Synchytrium endobioticum TaxID=286115 RepID=A0A507DGX2_9FUNG|nr:hypothetical protein SeMB42_g02064 [Synchytrium endobioticum]
MQYIPTSPALMASPDGNTQFASTGNQKLTLTLSSNEYLSMLSDEFDALKPHAAPAEPIYSIPYQQDSASFGMECLGKLSLKTQGPLYPTPHLDLLYDNEVFPYMAYPGDSVSAQSDMLHSLTYSSQEIDGYASMFPALLPMFMTPAMGAGNMEYSTAWNPSYHQPFDASSTATCSPLESPYLESRSLGDVASLDPNLAGLQFSAELSSIVADLMGESSPTTLESPIQAPNSGQDNNNHLSFGAFSTSPKTISIPSAAAPTTRKTKSEHLGKIPRPPNSFILYRRDKHEQILRVHDGIALTNLSKIISKMWQEEDVAVKEYYTRLAQLEKERHLAMYPQYKYEPRRSKDIKRRKLRGPGSNPPIRGKVERGLRFFDPLAPSADIRD